MRTPNKNYSLFVATIFTLIVAALSLWMAGCVSQKKAENIAAKIQINPASTQPALIDRPRIGPTASTINYYGPSTSTMAVVVILPWLALAAILLLWRNKHGNDYQLSSGAGFQDHH